MPLIYFNSAWIYCQLLPSVSWLSFPHCCECTTLRWHIESLWCWLIAFGVPAARWPVRSPNTSLYFILLGFTALHLLALHKPEGCWCRVMAAMASQYSTVCDTGGLEISKSGLGFSSWHIALLWQRSSRGTATEPLNSATSPRPV